MNLYHIEVKLCAGTDWCTALNPIEITAEHKEDVYQKILNGFDALEKQIPQKQGNAEDEQRHFYLSEDGFCRCRTTGKDIRYPLISLEDLDYCPRCGQALKWD